MEEYSKEEIISEITKLGITMVVEFIPFSRSRNAVKNPKLKDYNLNWGVTLLVSGVEVLKTDYMMGQGHCIGLVGDTNSYTRNIKSQCESGKILLPNGHGTKFTVCPPQLIDVLWSLMMDANALNFDSFEDWASDYGYDADSRKAEKLYRTNLNIGLRLRNSVGDGGLRVLQEVYSEY